ncbi:MAG: exodeoxyribonuclease I, partial [Silanimonas sp.]
LVAPLAMHPTIGTRVIAYDLSVDPAVFADLDDDTLMARLYTPRAALPEGVERLPLKEIHTNRCPALLPLAHVRPMELTSLGLDADTANARAGWLAANPRFIARCTALFAVERDYGPSDADGDLYGGFIDDADRRLFPRIRTADPATLPRFAAQLQDARLKTLLFRYQARNWPESLDAAQRVEWDAWRRARLLDGDDRADGSLAAFGAEWEEACQRITTDTERRALDQLREWRNALLVELGVKASEPH